MPEHTEKLNWPNGLGWTPCTKEYKDAFTEWSNLLGFEDSRDAQEQKRLIELDKLLSDLFVEGHRGKGVRYAR